MAMSEQEQNAGNYVHAVCNYWFYTCEEIGLPWEIADNLLSAVLSITYYHLSPFVGIEALHKERENELLRENKRLHERNIRQRRDLSEKDKKQLRMDTLRLGGRCPSCGIVEVVLPSGEQVNSEIDHGTNVGSARITDCWIICKACHAYYTKDSTPNTERWPMFAAFHKQRERLHEQPRLI